MLKCRQLALFVLLISLLFVRQAPCWALDTALSPASASVAPAETVTLAAADRTYVDELSGAKTAGLPAANLVTPDWYWTMSFLLPGLSQMMMDEPVHGLVFFIGFVATAALIPVALGSILVQNQPAAQPGQAAAPNPTVSAASSLATIFGVATVGFYLANLLDAYYLNQDKIKTEHAKTALQPNLDTAMLETARLMSSGQAGLAAHAQGIISFDYKLARF